MIVCKPINIVHLSKYYYPHIGGVEKHISEINKLISKEGHKVTVICVKHSSNLPSVEYYKKVKIVRIDYSAKRFIGLISLWVQLIKNYKLFATADVIHIHDVVIWYLPLKLLFLNHKNVYATFHGWEGIYPIPLKNKLIRQLSSAIVYKYINVGKYLDKYYGTKSDIVTYGATSFVRNRSIPKDRKLIVYLGRLDKDTGLDIFLQSMASNKYYDVYFCGDGEMRKKCEAIGRVLGFINPENIMQKASICVASGYLSIIEALSLECRVISLYNSSIRREILIDSPFRNYISIVGNPKKINNFLDDNKINYFNHKKNIRSAAAWASRQTWTEVYKKYAILWASQNSN